MISNLLRFLKRHSRTLFILLGFGLLTYLVMDAGPARIAQVLLGTSSWLPLILLLEVGWISFDTLALRSLYGEHRRLVPARAWIHSAFVAYTMMILLPAGRAGGEVARATMLSRWAGSVAVQRSTQLQSAVLLGNSAISLPCAVAVGATVGPTHILTLLVLGNGIATAVLGVALSLVLQRTGVGQWLERRFPGLAKVPGVPPSDLHVVPWKASLLTATGRSIQTLQYGVILAAVGGSLTLQSSLLSQGIHLVGAGLGDFVPNAVGVTEGAYRIFAGVLGLKDQAEKALSIALVGRFNQVAVAVLALAGSTLMAARSELSPKPPSEPPPV